MKVVPSSVNEGDERTSSLDGVVVVKEDEEDNSFETRFKKTAEKLSYSYSGNLLDEIQKQDQRIGLRCPITMSLMDQPVIFVDA